MTLTKLLIYDGLIDQDNGTDQMVGFAALEGADISIAAIAWGNGSFCDERVERVFGLCFFFRQK